ncbi:hypothetical protein B0H19DRAFT_1250413 [Mycena capillaripes]|nr:hypothetical protein B0H19DRAFT_1250413 [Mycena capillaripes]
MDILRAAPALVDCEFGDMQPDEVDVAPLTHLCLRHLRLGKCFQPDDLDGALVNTAAVLKHLTSPVLETLFIRALDISDDELSSFLTRSSPPLQSLHLAIWDSDDGLAGEHLRSVSSLTDLTIEYLQYNEDGQPDSVFETLAIDQKFLPNIRNLNIQDWVPDAHAPLLITVPTARRAKLHSFRVIFSKREESQLDDHLLATLRQLAQDGMEIHFGPSECNNYI